MIYIITVPVILLLLRSVLGLITSLPRKIFLDSLANRLYTLLESMGTMLRRIIGALAQLPKALFLVFIFSLLLNFYAYYFSFPLLSRWMNESIAYQSLYKNAVYPALNSNIAKQIPVLVNDSFRTTTEQVISDPGDSGSLAKLEQQIMVVGSEQDSQKKAYLIYKWVSQNIEYDYDKAARISKLPAGISSGSVIAFNTRKGICFDYSSLYISMCRAVGLKVRLISGLGYSGITWGDHAWNQVYSPEESRWINVDTTFGANGMYFDKADFNVDHKYAEVQGEW